MIIDQGQGRALIFIHGLPGQATDFTPIIEALRSSFRCVAYNRDGYGAAPDGGSIGIKASTREVIQLMEKLAIDQATLVGWSYGGHIALETAVNYPNRVNSVILLGSAGPTFKWPNSFVDKLLFQTLLGYYLFRFLHKLGPGAFQSQLDEAFGAPAPDFVRDQFWQLMSDHRTVKHWLAEGRVWNPCDSPVSEVRRPTLIIHGEQDTRVPVRVARDLANDIHNAQLCTLPGAGHWPFATHASEVASTVKGFLEETNATSASLV